MERIREAVERAKQDRESAAPAQQPAANGTAQPAPQVATPAGEPPSVKAQFPNAETISVPESVREANKLVAAIPGHPLQDTYRMLRTRILQEMRANNWTTLAVTSPATGSGKTVTAINLAISIGRDLSSTAFLFDADLRRPSVAQYFGYEPKYGIGDYLFNDIDLEQVLFHPDMDRLTVLPGRGIIKESAEMLGSPKFSALMEELRTRHPGQIVIADIAPVLSVDDALALAPTVDCMLVVAESGVTKSEDLSKALELLDGIPIIGTVLNKVDRKPVEAY